MNTQMYSQDDLLGLSLIHEVEFDIEVMPGTEPISMTPYKMAAAVLRE